MSRPPPVAFFRQAPPMSAFLLACLAAALPIRAAEADKTDPAIPSPTAAMIVVDHPPAVFGDNPPQDSDAALRRRINTHAATLRAGRHVSKALSNQASEIRKTRWFAASEDPRERIEWLRRNAKVRVIPDTALIEISLDAVEDPAARQKILHELAITYDEERREVRTMSLLERTEALTTVRLNVAARLGG